MAMTNAAQGPLIPIHSPRWEAVMAATVDKHTEKVAPLSKHLATAMGTPLTEPHRQIAAAGKVVAAGKAAAAGKAVAVDKAVAAVVIGAELLVAG